MYIMGLDVSYFLLIMMGICLIYIVTVSIIEYIKKSNIKEKKLINLFLEKELVENLLYIASSSKRSKTESIIQMIDYIKKYFNLAEIILYDDQCNKIISNDSADYNLHQTIITYIQENKIYGFNNVINTDNYHMYIASINNKMQLEKKIFIVFVYNKRNNINIHDASLLTTNIVNIFSLTLNQFT